MKRALATTLLAASASAFASACGLGAAPPKAPVAAPAAPPAPPVEEKDEPIIGMCEVDARMPGTQKKQALDVKVFEADSVVLITAAGKGTGGFDFPAEFPLKGTPYKDCGLLGVYKVACRDEQGQDIASSLNAAVELKSKFGGWKKHAQLVITSFADDGVTPMGKEQVVPLKPGTQCMATTNGKVFRNFIGNGALK
jgi:hypothetical protein